MGLRTYQHKISNGIVEKTVGIKAKKSLATSIISELGKLKNIGNWSRELTGVRGETEGFQKETSCLLMSMFGTPKPLEDQAGFDMAYSEWIQGLPDIIYADNMRDTLKSASLIFTKHVRVDDNPRTHA